MPDVLHTCSHKSTTLVLEEPKLSKLYTHYYYNQTRLPQSSSVSAPNSLCPIFKFLTSFFLQMHHQSVKTKVNFSITHLVRTVCQLTTSTKQTHYTWTTLFCIHLRNSFSIEHRRTLSPPKNTPCVLLSLMLTRPFLSSFGLVGVCFLRFVHFSSSSSVSFSHLSPTAMKMANFYKVSMQSQCSLVQQPCLTVRTGRIHQPQKLLEICKCQ